MGFSSFKDAPYQIKTEGEKISLSFSPGVPNVGQGTVSWNIPTPSEGCSGVEKGLGVYCGIVVVLSTSELLPDTKPVDGQKYTGDPTANKDLHTGDVLGDGLVVGAFYEGEKKANNQQLTNSFVISDLSPDDFYFVTAYAVDCQGRYHSDGVAAYSRSNVTPEEPGTPSKQTVVLNNGAGRLLSDGTGLTPGVSYLLDVMLDDNFPTGPSKTAHVSIDGIDAGTFGQLVDQIQEQVDLIGNPIQSPVAPNTGRIYRDPNGKLFTFDGTEYQELSAVYEDTDPSLVTNGTYWYNPTTKILSHWDDVNSIWNPTQYISFTKVQNDISTGDVWFDGTTTYSRCGSTWCKTPHILSPVDPTLPVELNCGVLWFGESLQSWNGTNWESASALYWHDSPSSLSPTTFWWDIANAQLKMWDGSSWTDTSAYSGISPPNQPNNSDFWYDPSNEQLHQWDAMSSSWDDVDAISWDTDPTDVTSCELWWNSSDNTIYKWNSVSSAWDPQLLYEQQQDPHSGLIPTLNSMWVEQNSNTIYQWSGTDWQEVSYINYPTDPTIPTNGMVWLNTTTSQLMEYQTTQWVDVTQTVIDSTPDPTSLSSGTMWYDTSNQQLFERSGTSWISVPISTTHLLPQKGTIWYDDNIKQLKMWNGSAWVDQPSPIQVALVDGNIEFTTSGVGSNMCVMLPTPGDQGSVGTGLADFTAAGISSSYATIHYGLHENVPLPLTNITPDEFLFGQIPGTTVTPQIYGTDGVNPTPSYDQLSVGDDGSPDERRELMDSIRQQLGHPVVEVELTTYQMDTAIQSAIEALRHRSSIAYKRGFFFLDVTGGQQRYMLTNKQIGYHKIVTVTSAHRFTSSFLSTVGSSGIYGQVMLQQLYGNGGMFDLTSFHLIAQQIEQMEHLFATRLTFNWDETNRTLDLFNSFGHKERILLDCSVERTEQELLKDRWTKTWIEKYSSAQARLMLAEIRGKYASLPGAGGGVSLNAQELINRADIDIQDCLLQLDDYITNDIEQWGLGSTLAIG